MSYYKTKFKKYCEGKIKDLGEATYIDPIWNEEETRKIFMTAENLRGVENARVLDPEDNENLLVIDTHNKVIYDTPMLDPVMYALRLEFNAIDTKFYEDMIEYWDNVYADEIMERMSEEVE